MYFLFVETNHFVHFSGGISTPDELPSWRNFWNYSCIKNEHFKANL